jgi:NADH:ubiquinone oxidoreductase subunit 6 (subunit J)
MEKMDSFTIAVLLGAVGVIAGFILMMVFDKKKSAAPAPTGKPSGK